jgi:hypothetical protein
MKNTRLQLSSEQTLRLRELRNTLAEVLPADVAETVQFQTVSYAPWCPGCQDSCQGQCVLGCLGSCKGRCKGVCQ